MTLDDDYRVSIKQVRKHINNNTIALVGSAPNFPHGVIDDIAELNHLAEYYNLMLHVDSCMGGLLTCFFEAAKIKDKIYDFRYNRVTSISADLHKYGQAPKGVSLLLFKNAEIRRHIFFSAPKYEGGFYATPTTSATRSPAAVVSAYMILCLLGKNHYIQQTKNIHNAVVGIKNYVKEKLPNLVVMGNPYVSIISFTGERVAQIYDQLIKKDWNLNLLSSPIGISYAITSANLPLIADGTFIKDLTEAYNKVFLKINATKGLR